MAGIGFSKPYFAIYTATGNAVTYSNGAVLGKGIELSMDLDGANDNVLYADNGPAESDNSFSGGTLTLTTDNLDATVLVSALGAQSQAIDISGMETTGASWVVFDERQVTPYCGFGGIVKHQINNVIKWQAIIFPKIQFVNINNAATTQGESIEWQTPEIEATLMRDDTVNHQWRLMSSMLDTEADAELLIRNFLNITAGGGGA